MSCGYKCVKVIVLGIIVGTMLKLQQLRLGIMD